MSGEVPASGTTEYLWWSQGAADEAKARDEGMSPSARELRHLLEGLARLRPLDPPVAVLASMVRIQTAGLPLRRKIGLALRCLR